MIIYKITNLINGKIYIGKDAKNDPNYFGSGKLLSQAIKKYGLKFFKKEILEKVSKENINEREIYWINFHNSTSRYIGYNIAKGGSGGDTITNNPEKEKIKEKIGKKSSGRKHNNKSKSLISKIRTGQGNGMYGKIPWNKGLLTSDETKKKISEKNTGRKRKPLTKEHKEKLVACSKKPKTKEHKEKLSQALIGKKRSIDAIELGASKLRGRSQNKLQCPYCGKIGGTTMKRWHFEKCRDKK